MWRHKLTPDVQIGLVKTQCMDRVKIQDNCKVVGVFLYMQNFFTKTHLSGERIQTKILVILSISDLA